MNLDSTPESGFIYTSQCLELCATEHSLIVTPTLITMSLIEFLCSLSEVYAYYFRSKIYLFTSTPVIFCLCI